MDRATLALTAAGLVAKQMALPGIGRRPRPSTGWRPSPKARLAPPSSPMYCSPG